jgi:hypothetical protein
MLKIVHFQNVFGAVNGMVLERCNNGLNIPKWKSEEAVNQRRIYHTMVKETGQKDKQRPSIKEGYIIQWSKKQDKRTNSDLQNITQKTKRSNNTNSLKIGDEPRCSGRVAVPAPLVTHVELPLNDTNII